MEGRTGRKKGGRKGQRVEDFLINQEKILDFKVAFLHFDQIPTYSYNNIL